MGREIKRVEAGFNWPIGEVWKGFVDNPHHPRECKSCDGTGSSEPARFFHDQWYGNVPFDPRSTGSKPLGDNHPKIIELARRNILFDVEAERLRAESPWDAAKIRYEARRLATECFDSHWSSHLSPADVAALIKADRLCDLTSKWSDGEWKKTGHIPTPAEVNEWSFHGMAHDSINAWVCVSARCEREGVSSKCPACDGSGVNPEDKEIAKACEEWTDTPPPAGDWWQVWETVSEGSPVTPAFATSGDLVDYLVLNGDAWDQKRGRGGWERQKAEEFVNSGFAMSMIVSGGKIYEPRDGMPEVASKA